MIAIQSKSIESRNPSFKLEKTDIDFTFGPIALAEEIATWRRVYGIDERYKARLLSKHVGKYWVTQALDEWPKLAGGLSEYLAEMKHRAKEAPIAELNFLKSPFLEACQLAGIL